MRRLFLSSAQAGDLVDDVFVISGKQLAAGSNGKFYIKVFVSDKTAQVTSRKWNATRETFNALPESGFVRIKGRIENYQNNLQLIIEDFFMAKPDTFDVGDLMPHTEQDIGQMSAKLRGILGTLKHPSIKALIQTYLDDAKLMADFERAPAAQTFHHAYIGGLLEHTVSVLQVADAVTPFYPKLSRDLVLAGVFLHDIAKTWELCYDCAFTYTDGGYLVGHIVKSAMWVEHKAAEAERKTGQAIPQPLIDVLQHIILSHHGEPEYGAAKTPATPEAIFVHYVENLDAKMMMSLSATRGEVGAGSEGNWTEYMKAFSGRLYRPDPCAAEEPTPAPEPAAATPEPPVAAGSMAISNPLFESTPPKKR